MAAGDERRRHAPTVAWRLHHGHGRRARTRSILFHLRSWFVAAPMRSLACPQTVAVEALAGSHGGLALAKGGAGRMPSAKTTLGVDSTQHRPFAAATAGVLAVCVHDCFVSPWDVVKQRLQLGFYGTPALTAHPPSVRGQTHRRSPVAHPPPHSPLRGAVRTLCRGCAGPRGSWPLGQHSDGRAHRGAPRVFCGLPNDARDERAVPRRHGGGQRIL